jgi:hypothetical protein
MALGALSVEMVSRDMAAPVWEEGADDSSG